MFNDSTEISTAMKIDWQLCFESISTGNINCDQFKIDKQWTSVAKFTICKNLRKWYDEFRSTNVKLKLTFQLLFWYLLSLKIINS